MLRKVCLIKGTEHLEDLSVLLLHFLDNAFGSLIRWISRGCVDQAGLHLTIVRSRLMCNPGQSKKLTGWERAHVRGRIPTTWHYFIVGVD